MPLGFLSAVVVVAAVTTTLGVSHGGEPHRGPVQARDTRSQPTQLDLARRHIKHIVFLIKENRTFDNLFGTSYGRLLSLKILFYLAMVGIALRNRFRLAPLLSGECASGAGALYRSVLVEQAIGLAILVAVSVLGTWAPPVAPHH